MSKPVSYIIEADIKGFFDNVSHDWMMKSLQVRIRDSSLLLLIRRFLKAGYIESGKLVRTEQGTPQGGNLTPQTMLQKPLFRGLSKRETVNPIDYFNVLFTNFNMFN